MGSVEVRQNPNEALGGCWSIWISVILLQVIW